MEPIVIVGGDAAGMSAASKFKRERPDREVIVFEKGEFVSYAACGMPYYVKGTVEEFDDLLQVPPEEFTEERDIDLRLHHEVVGIDPDAHEVTVSAPGGEFTQPYDQLLIATGARAIEPPFEGMDLDGVYTLHSLDSAKEVHDAMETQSPESVAIVGGGYVGIEMAEAFDAHDVDVHLFEMLPHVLAPFGETVAEKTEAHLREEGVELHLDTAVDGFSGDDGHVTGVIVGDETYSADLVLVGVGVTPNAELAAEAGIELGESGAIATDEHGRTSAEGVFAAGDCAEARNVVTGEPDYVPLALTANRAGRAIGQTMAGDPTPVGDIAGTAAVKAFELEAARTGIIDEESAREAGFDPVSVTIDASTRAHYCPGAEQITITMLGDKESGRVLGAAMVGREGVAKRVDTVAAALHTETTVDELAYFDLSYAPPFSPPWDPVLTTAKVLGGKLD
ncbi:pyridine nucleotide-disulfide oxidoreductase (plasmid) [Haloferax mediterranei ATCC 33500]|uniref:NADH oxidase n=1 Tax=Haloferax mediterranei (strain ATCC 33500 / DSM 1411 / JCM 8866 / NBRC 14739 / NCIMB 2177 / R-4) TaxID=523841 RepID=I3RB56_HALMT|nr:FAD-dependent oxidoreductase [Haloferax mediterranei]AFK21466.1 NADH oxidase [Haloferax mediterranei ATCC 33500]AHZ24470.1 pyridine nucleotide-disulfide oxidoreductase [Haloferax mediterranei ATCC 33500]ELZ97217.1 NADH oxidase [Haloferax mediterranei ATCC 33500]MDX5990045.1 FAD-dependent oxidoreductase [Haloferax mediterranei ATCC 33500]QCQ76868.1 pyridine nucleotide-disulfide oxidoreductase [Haloferax mediterranei ATCC 33500]